MWKGISLGLISLTAADGFRLPNKSSTILSKPALKMSSDNNLLDKIFNINNKMGEAWKFSDLFDSEKLKGIESVNILPDAKTAYVIDKVAQNTSPTIENIHSVTLSPFSMNALIESLTKNHVNILNVPENTNVLYAFIMKVGDLFVNVALFFFFITFITNIFGRGMNFGPDIDKANYQIINPDKEKTTFEDVAGCDEAKMELTEVVDFLKSPEKYKELGAKIPKGVLLEGNPGTGKTLLARAVAGEAGVSFISASGSEFIEMYVGVGASRVRKLFSKAQKLAPCVVFIDEIDAVGRQRGAGIAGGNDEREQTLNQILTNMDGFTADEGVIVMAATNRVDILDSALIRPGRFDRKVKVPLPSLEGRKRIFQVHIKNKKMAEDVDMDMVASITTGFSGADLANMANEAAILAARKNQTSIDNKILYEAYEKMTIGLTSIEQEKDLDIQELVTFHECGHAMAVLLFEEMFDLKKITINGNTNGAGGYTLFTPKEKFTKFATKRFMLANLIIALGGRAAEIFLFRDIKCNLGTEYGNIFGGIDDLDVTTGASNDLIQANKIARDYITRYGFGDGYNYHDPSNFDKPFMGRELSMSTDKISESTKRDIDMQVGKLVSYAQEKAYDIIKNNKNSFLTMVKQLEEKRIINKDDLGKDFDINKNIQTYVEFNPMNFDNKR
jgi:cell division protease FtsH